MAFASGKKAWGICDISGFRYRLRDMKKTWDGFLVGPDQWSPKHPQLNPPHFTADAEALRNPRPARTEPVADALLTNNPFLSTAGSAVIKVFEDDHGRSTGDKVRFRGAEAFDGFTSGTLVDPDAYSITKVDADTYTFSAVAGTGTSGARGGGAFVSVGPAQALLPLNPFRTAASGENAIIHVTEFKHNRTTGDTVRFRSTEAFDGITTTVLESSNGYTITVVDDNEYKFTSTGTATTGDITGGGSTATAGPTS
jgi:hypothetical protein|tara:strand:- start:3287 stop:4048 length:762 start_codon:yes stop_codon:yes gene_type:complete